MPVVKIGRLILSLVMAGLAGWMAYTYVSMPYELVQTVSTRPVPDGSGVFFLAIVFAVFSLVAAFSGDWA